MQAKKETRYDSNKIGPGHYEFQGGAIKKGTEWSKYKAKRVDGKQNEKNLLGPGAYNPVSQPFMPMYKKSKNFMFSSQVPKTSSMTNPNMQSQRINENDSEDEEEEVVAQVPGPGSYYNPKSQTAFKTKDVPVERQFFGSTVDRFQKKQAPIQDTNLGPGSYSDIRNGFQNKKAYKVPFLTNKKRFYSATDDNPGPGIYKVKEFKDSVKEKTWGRQGVFGSTEKRFAPTTTGNEV